MIRARGILTALGGMTSHAAVVARGFGKPAVTGCKAIEIDLEDGRINVDGKALEAGDIITIEGSSGRVAEGEVPLIDAELSGEFEQILAWADELRDLNVRANAD